MVYNVAYASGVWVQTLAFRNKQEYLQWASWVENTKRSIEAINMSDDDEEGSLRLPLYLGWLDAVGRFTRRWGEGLVPPDIKHAVNSVEFGIGVPQTVWADPPENHLLGGRAAA